MQIVIFTIGTEGDVRPLVSLGCGLKQAGHQVRIASDPGCAGLIEQAGLEFAPLSGDFIGWMRADQALQKQGLAVFSMVRAFQQRLRDLAQTWPEQGRRAAEGADLLIGNGMVFLLAEALAETLGLPVVETQVVPTLPSHNPPLMPMPTWMYGLPPAANYLLGHMVRRMVWHVFRPAYNDVVRPTLGLAPYSRRGPNSATSPHLKLFGYSPTLVEPGRNWPKTVHVTGPWTLEEAESWQPPVRLQRFLEAGPPPVYVGFGSMFNHDAEAFTATVIKAVRQAGKRLVLARGWGGLAADFADDDQVIAIERAPHDWLFPRMALAVHHGGAGTTIAACRAAIPSVVLPVFGDQLFWALRLQKLGVAPSPIARETLTSDMLSAAIRMADSLPMRQRAEQLGKTLNAERGVETAIAILERAGLLSSAYRRAG
ncbi:glycosyltransferase [Allorhizobium sp. BGMRC 0089]|uniref:glycosyltransferase n=1 Tax=Allorhizobium sonneratiae TaxID=2934936 RepID=UPI002034A4CB|nr:glycosyltransferase [Allorhizobium sonneratiae]MCM2294171.1 glycosyltransferase [Allorhizobium sonneratiae]